MEDILARKTTSISEFKANPNREVALAGDEPFCVLTNNRPSFYVMSAKAWDELMDWIDQQKLAAEVKHAESDAAGKTYRIPTSDLKNGNFPSDLGGDQSMLYAISYLPHALRKLRKLDPHIRGLVLDAIEARAENPDKPAARLAGELAGYYKIKLQALGLRVIYRIDESTITIVVVTVGKREDDEVYRAAVTAYSDLERPGPGKPKPNR